MAKLDLNQAEFTFHSAALAGATLAVYQFSGRESLSQPFEFQIDLVCEDRSLDLEAPIAQSACLVLSGRLLDGSRYERCIHGVIERFVQLGAGIRHSRYQATLVPTIKPLAYTRSSRIFQKQSAPAVTQKVLSDDQVAGDWVSPMLHGSYGARDYCVQYQESDLEFIQRLWEEEGIFYFFEHSIGKDKLVLGDGGHAFAELTAYPAIRLRDTPHLHEEGLSEFCAESSLRPGATVLRDFKFQQPSLDMEATAQAGKFGAFKMYYSPGEYVDPGIGQRLVQVRLEELQCQKLRYVGTGNVRAMLPGHTFSLLGHRRPDCNQEYVICAVEHRGTQPAALGEEAGSSQVAVYQNRVECIPAKVPFRPARQTPRPRIPGVQTAVVVGPPGEEIHCDEYGRVKVKFHWDRDPGCDDNSSCWIRVSQPWAGSGQGGIFIPRIGQEVVVQFLEGDPDRPLIVGRVYNGTNPVPHGLPGAKNISTIRSASTPGGGGYNELKFDDTKGKEEIFIHAQFDMNEVVEHNHNTTVQANQTNTVTGNHTNTITGNHTESVQLDQTLSVTGNQTSSVQLDRTFSVQGNQTSSVQLDQALHVNGNQTETVKQNQTSTVAQGNQSISVLTGTRTLCVKGDVTDTVLVGNHTTSIQTGASSLTVKQDRDVTVLNGNHNVLVVNKDSTLTVNTGNHITNVATGSHSTTVKQHHVTDVLGGNTTLTVAAGSYTAQADKTIHLESRAGKLELVAQNKVIASSEAEIDLIAPTIYLSGKEINLHAGQKLTLSCGPSTITLDPSGVHISGPLVESNADGTHIITGAVIKLN